MSEAASSYSDRCCIFTLDAVVQTLLSSVGTTRGCGVGGSGTFVREPSMAMGIAVTGYTSTDPKGPAARVAFSRRVGAPGQQVWCTCWLHAASEWRRTVGRLSC